MEYKNIKLSKAFTIKNYYAENHYIISVSFAKGYVYIDDDLIDIDNSCVVIIPKYRRVSCNITPKFSSRNIEIYYIAFSEEALGNKFIQLPNNYKKNNCIQYKLPTPICIERNFQIWKETDNVITDENLRILLIEQGLYFILSTLSELGINIQNIFHLNYKETKKEGVVRLVTQSPQKKWNINIIAKLLFTTPSTLRRHLTKEGVIFSDLILDIRMGLAINLLTFTNYTVSQISNKTGFGGSTYFCYAFKRKYNLTPLQFRVESRKYNSNQIT